MPVAVMLLPLKPVERATRAVVVAPWPSRYVWISGDNSLNQVGVAVANSAEIAEAAAPGLVRASAWRDDGRTE